MHADKTGPEQEQNGFAQEMFRPRKKSGGKPAFLTSS